MVPSEIVRRARKRLARRNEYHRLFREIENFSDRELCEMGTTRHEIRREAWRAVHGMSRVQAAAIPAAGPLRLIKKTTTAAVM
jgi:uncharacterized protein YjiS (DUF1127 family)